MIASFGDRLTEALHHGESSSQLRRLSPALVRAATRKLDMMNAAASLSDLASPPGNRLEALMGDRGGFYSIRINAQWRLVFRWDDGDAHDVSIVDYHA